MSAPHLPARRSAEELEATRLARLAGKTAQDFLIRGDGINPSAIERLWQILNDNSTIVREKLDGKGNVRERVEEPAVTVKERVMIASFLERVAAHRPLLHQSFGILKQMGLATSIKAETVNVLHYTDGMTPEERAIVQRLRLNQLHERRVDVDPDAIAESA